jgi:hypothetical protein
VIRFSVVTSYRWDKLTAEEHVRRVTEGLMRQLVVYSNSTDNSIAPKTG